MIADRDLVTIRRAGAAWSYGTMPRPNAEAAIALRGGLDRFETTSVPSCRCCGELAFENLRCAKHHDRNPCLVEGCRRTGKAGRGELADDQLICGQHWRTYVPPGSAMRRTYRRFWRLAKKHGWTPELIARFERFWRSLVRRVRARATDGFLDQREIEQMFGWSEAA